MDLRIIPNLSVDCVIFGYENGSLNVFLMKRTLQNPDQKTFLVDDYVLTGYHAFKSETLDETAGRVLKELTGVDNIYKKQFKTFGDPERLMNPKDRVWAQNQEFNERTITVAYYFLLPTDSITINKSNCAWFPIKELPALGFDHEQIISEAYDDLQKKIIYEPMVFELLPDKFTLNELQALYEAIWDCEFDNRNFRKKILKRSYIVPLEEKRKGVSKKPSRLYMFSRDIYDKIFKKSSIVNL